MEAGAAFLFILTEVATVIFALCFPLVLKGAKRKNDLDPFKNQAFMLINFEYIAT